MSRNLPLTSIINLPHVRKKEL
jgi:putative membrane protein